MTVATAARELPLALVECCTRYVVSMMHPVPACIHCDEIPKFLSETNWWLEIPESIW